jgi:Uma2 family endonuclease
MTYTINVKAFTEQISDRDLLQISSDNPELRFETDARGNLVVMPLRYTLYGMYNAELLGQLGIWNHQHKLGVAFDSSTGFRLSNGAVRSPNVSWIAIDKWNSLNDEQKKGFAPIDPDFVIELLSPSDELTATQQKMQEYLSCGVKLGWLINPDAKEVEVYRLGKEKEKLKNPSNLSGEEILPGLTVDLEDIL